MTRKIFYSVLVIGLIIRLIISFSIEFSITHGISSDDSYYYFRIAQNIANGYGSTFDQINPTNGYQPLVLWFLVLNYKIFAYDIFTPIIISQIILSLISTFAAYLTFNFVKRLSGDDFAALLSTTFIFLNPVLIAINFKSLETNFYWLFLIISFLFYDIYLKNFSDEKDIKKYFLFGLIISLAALSRLDGGFYILAFAIYLLSKKEISIISKFKKVFSAGIGFSLLFIPYLIYNYINFKNPVPISGRAKVFHNHRAVLSQVGDYFTIDFILYEIRRFIFPFNFDLFANRGFGLVEQIAVYVVIVTVIILVVLFLKSGYIKVSLKQWKGFGFIPLYLLFHYSFYTLYFWEYRFYYFLPEFIILTIFLLMALNNWLNSKFLSVLQKVKIFVLSLIMLIFILGGIKIFTAQHEQTLAYKTAQWIKENLPKEKIYASANTGILSYFTQFRFINLDGMVNNDELLEVYKKGEKEYLQYLKRKKIDYLVDYFLSDKPENKYYFPKILNNKYEVVKVFTDKRLKYQKLNHMLVIKLKI
ncbi:MAG: glycosyltransferase family 39 protein [Ignavibacteria bacterium]|nr:glycosyltransferase family 39 protein [Ignavibacteria bacterium]